MDKRKGNNLIAQSRPLVEAKYNFGVWELRLFIEVVQQIKKEDKDLRKYRLYYSDILKQYGGHKNDYTYIRNASRSLIHKIAIFKYFTDKGTKRDFRAVLFTTIDSPENWKEDDNEMYIDFTINPDLKEQLIQLKRNYLLYDKRNILKLRSKFAVRIYQILKSYERKDSNNVIIELSVKELRETLLVDDNGMSTNQFQKFYLFKKHVILIAQRQIEEHTDIAFTFEEIKKGRRVDSIKFHLRKNRKASKPKQLATKSKVSELEPIEELDSLESDDSEVFVELTRAGISVDGAYALIGKFRNDELLLAELRFAQKELKNAFNVKSDTGFIISSIKKQSFRKSELARKKLQDQKKKGKAKQKETIEFHTKQIDKLRAEYIEERNAAVKALLKGKSKKQANNLVEKCLEDNPRPFVLKAIKEAEKKNKEQEVYDLKYSVLASDKLTGKGLANFDSYLLDKGLRLNKDGKYPILQEI